MKIRNRPVSPVIERKRATRWSLILLDTTFIKVTCDIMHHRGGRGGMTLGEQNAFGFRVVDKEDSSPMTQ